MIVKSFRSAGGPLQEVLCVPLNELRYKRQHVLFSGNFKVRREKLSFIKVERKGTKNVGTGNIFKR